MCSFWAKSILFELEKYTGVTKFGEESSFRFKLYIKNLANFDLSTWKTQTF